MQKVTKRWISVLLTAVLLGSLFMLTPLSAAAAENETGSLSVSATSNYFPAAENFYSDFSTLEDENGDVFVTVEYKLLAIGKYLVNIDLGELTYDPAVLEWDESYNQFGDGRTARLDLFPLPLRTTSARAFAARRQTAESSATSLPLIPLHGRITRTTRR